MALAWHLFYYLKSVVVTFEHLGLFIPLDRVLFINIFKDASAPHYSCTRWSPTAACSHVITSAHYRQWGLL